MSAIWSARLCVVCVLWMPHLADAQDVVDVPATPSPATPSTEDVVQARARFGMGTLAMDEGRFELAIEHFEASLQLAARPATAFDLAIALRGAGHPTRAVVLLDALLAGTYGVLRGAQLAEVRALRDAAFADVAHVRIRIAVADEVELRMDGLRIEEITPGAWSEHTLDPGRHAITASARGRVTTERVVLLERGAHAELDLELAPELRPGTLDVIGQEPDLQVEIVGVARGRGQVTAEVPPGEYIVRALSNGGGVNETHIEIPSNRTVRLRVSGQSRQLTDDPWFWVTLTASAVALGGAAVGIVFAIDPPLGTPFSDPVFGVTATLGER